MKRIVLIVSTVIMMLSPVNLLAATKEDKSAARNDTVFYSPTDGGNATCTGDTGGGGGGGGGGTLSGSDNPHKALNFLIAKGLQPYQAAGIVGNLMWESGGVDPTAQEDGSNDTSPKNGVGFGIAQWSFTVRQAPLVAVAAKENKPATDLGVQLDYLWDELTHTAPANDYTSSLAAVKGSSNYIDATTKFMNVFESPNAALAHLSDRIANAKSLLTPSQYGGGGGGGTTTSPGPTPTPVDGGPGDCGSGGGGGTGTVDCTATTGQTKNLSATRQAAVCIAEAELKKWTSGQLKPIDGYLAYSQNRTEEWCADFVSWVYDQAKYPLQPDPGWNVPAVSDVMTIGQSGGGGKWHWHARGGYTPKPGDLVIHKENGNSHVNMVIAVQGSDGLTLLGGDQGPGPYPGGSNVSTVDVVPSVSDITGYVTPD